MNPAPPAAGLYLGLVHRGRNHWWRYLVAVAIIVLFAGVLGNIPLLILRDHYEYSGMRAFVAANFASLVALAGLVIAVMLVHRRSVLSLITPYARFDWRRAAQGFGVWVVLGVAICTVETLLYPGRYRLTFNPDTFFWFAAVALCLTPLQTATEELLFRGYVMQSLGLLVKNPATIAIGSAVIFMLPHLANPEVAHDPLLVPPQYLLIGLLLAALTLLDGRLELAIGIHAANNLFIALIVNYDDSVITTDAIFTAGYDPLYALVSLLFACIVTFMIFLRWRTAARQRSTRGNDRSIGFSQKIALPARAAAIARSACVSVEDAISTASTIGSASTRATLAGAAPYLPASDAAAVSLTSTTYSSRVPPSVARLAAWIAPMRPAPNCANRSKEDLLPVTEDFWCFGRFICFAQWWLKYDLYNYW